MIAVYVIYLNTLHTDPDKKVPLDETFIKYCASLGQAHKETKQDLSP